MENSYLVIDTEGKDFITEIAIIKKGELIYEKFLESDEDLKEIYEIINNQTLIAHFAIHDKEILERSFQKINLKFEAKFICTYELAKSILDIEKYSLEILSIHLNLKVNNKFFNSDLAHRASYDAIFTYKLYNKLLDIQSTLNKAKKVNPFSSSKVDNPFQYHFDFTKIYQREFNYLLSILDEIKQDKNHQTKSVVILGEAGSGKTHLMMRFVKYSSKTNRFLFIRHPNDSESIIFHIYSRILESFVQKIDNSKYSQLEYLLAKSFSKIIIENMPQKPTQIQMKILDLLKQNHLNIYEIISANQKNIVTIMKLMLQWWEKNYSANEIAVNILKALVKYAQYKDPVRKKIIINYLSANHLEEEELEKVGLDSWKSISREEFSLEAISLFGKLSIFDEPMILCFDQLESLINDEVLLRKFGESLKEIITHTPNSLIILNLFPNKWEYFLDFFDSSIIDRIGNDIISLPKISKTEIKNLLREKAMFYGINLDYIFQTKHYDKIIKYPSIRTNINYANHYYKHIIHKIPIPKISTNTLEDKFIQLLQRVEKLEKMLKITKPKKELDNSIDEYLEKIYKQKYKEYQELSIIDDKDEKGKLKTILLTIKDLYSIEIDFFKLRRVLPEHIIVKKDNLSYAIGFLNLNGVSFSSRIKNYTNLMLSYPNIYFRIFRDDRENRLSKTLRELITKFNQKGKFIFLKQDEKVIFETLYQVVEDYNNKDTNYNINELMESFIIKFSNFWLSKFLTK